MSTHPKYPRVFSPARLGPIEVPNRFYFSPHGLPLTVGCSPSNDLVAYCTERVGGGGCGLIILSCTVHSRGRDFQPCPYPRESIPAFRALAQAVHAAGGKIFAQLWYHWLSTGHWQPMAPRAPSLAPSAAQFSYGGVSGSTHAVTREEIRLVLRCFQQSVTHLREAGFDGAEIHASHSGIIEQFLSPYFNQRADEYGGSLENRMRLLVESLQTSREAAGSAMAVGMRLNCDELVEGGYDTSAAYEIVRSVCGQGLVDFVDLDVAMEPLQLKYGMPTVFVDEHVYRPYVEKVRGAAGGTPVLSVLGRVTRMADAEVALAAGVCDLVGATRELLAEPRFVVHARQNTEELSRTCIACNWCLGGMAVGAFGCAINPASYRERLWGVDRHTGATQPSKIVIVGAGPGGLEAARVAALRGHTVTLLEAGNQPGGALALWARLPGRSFYHRAIDWWERELARLGVIIRLNTRATAASVLMLEPDAVIIATGAQFSRTGRSGIADRDIPGWDRKHVRVPEQILEGDSKPTGDVVVLDAEGTHAGSGVAELLARGGANVTLVSANFAPYGSHVLYALEGELIAQALDDAGVQFRPATWVHSIGEREIQTYDVNSGRQSSIKADAVVLATGRIPNDSIARELEGRVRQLFTIGDALCVRPLATATYEGHKFARLIGEHGAPKSVAEAYFAADDPAVYPAPAA